MGFKSLKVSNFRGIKSLALTDLKRINIFVGSNNSGKTSVLESIFLTTGMSNPQLALSIDLFRNLAHNEGDDFRFIFHKLDYDNEPTFDAILDREEERTLVIKPRLTSSFLGSSALNDGKIPELSSTRSQGGVVSDGLFFEFSQKMKHSQKIQQKATISFDKGRINITPAKTYQESLYGVFLTAQNASTYSDQYKRVENLVVSKQKSQIIDVLKIIDPSIKDFELLSNNMVYFDKGLNRLEPSNISGEGLKKLFGLITTIFFTKGGIVLIDEIENGFYFKTLNSIWNVIVKAAIEYDVQLFISTHSLEALQELNKSLLDDSLKDQKVNLVNLYSLIKKEDGAVSAISYNADQFENAIANENEVR